MAQNLPQEIVDLVLSEFKTSVYSERRNIAECGLVCKNWLPSSRYRLFAEVDLNDRSMQPFIRIVETSSFPIPRFIRTLGLSSGREDHSLDENLRKLGLLPQLTTLRITMDHAVFAQNSALLVNSFTNISNLVFHNCQLPLRSVMDAVSSFPGLKGLVLHWVTFDTVTSLNSGYQFPSGWCSLTLNLSGNGIEDFFQAILSLGDAVPVFSSLSIRGRDPPRKSFLEKYLSHVGNGLHQLRLESDGERFRLFSSPTAPIPKLTSQPQSLPRVIFVTVRVSNAWS